MREWQQAYYGIGAGLVLILLGALLTLADPARAESRLPEPAQACHDALDAAEPAHNVPRNLLTAIAFEESGRWHAATGRTMAWPWTVTSGAESWYFETRAAAIAHVRALRAEGTTNIDVGCLQVNLHWHGDAFADLAEAFDPRANTRYAVDFLTDLKRRHNSWMQAVAHYHAGSEVTGTSYRRDVRARWHTVRRQRIERRLAQRGN